VRTSPTKLASTPPIGPRSIAHSTIGTTQSTKIASPGRSSLIRNAKIAPKRAAASRRVRFFHAMPLIERIT
jgi:hypothetical protein